MQIAMLNNTTQGKRNLHSEAGFTLLEMAAAMVILLIGCLALASAITVALTVSNKGRDITNTKLLAISVLEQMEALRNTKQLTYDQINNVGQVDNTGASQDFPGFLTDFQPVTQSPGPDGIFGTADDLLDPGTDGIYGTGDDFQNPALAHPNYIRRITITSLSSTLKKVHVTVRYPNGTGQPAELSAISYMNNDAHSNYIY